MGDEFELDDVYAWPSQLMDARQMEEILRCKVCGEYLAGPVLLQGCSHTFCSECVRKHLLSKGTSGSCPECKKACSSSDLIPNRPLEHLVVHFRALKPKVLQLASGTASLEDLDTKEAASKANQQNNDAMKKMPIVVYHGMKDKQISQLLIKDGLGKILPTSHDNMVNCHKEFIHMWNAQLDTINPKSLGQVRNEVVEAFKARQKEKSTLAATKRELGLHKDDPLENAPAINDNFRKMAQKMKAQKDAKPSAEDKDDGAQMAQDDPQNTMPNGDMRFLPRDNAGTWRNLYVNSLEKSIYVNSVTNEVLDKAPPATTAKLPPKAESSPSPVKRPVEPTVWACGMCTLENPLHFLRCEACGQANPNPPPTTKPERPKRSRQSKLSL
ncbi:Aste57867_19049 [Aphanomyces stellatus]|uniref:RanBP-type and C3HC4-type zinc finger-containing protein 1 n=1 Tax=Aphanomyces stellatus TaxID=120398 RepID=A0A485LDL3_9STRA|nr:hypothetical protein As57867_018985 [Aphanomyces stellatus]VFT95774.1 Aste57867_19049 [Aphanomyces stellatus]